MNLELHGAPLHYFEHCVATRHVWVVSMAVRYALSQADDFCASHWLLTCKWLPWNLLVFCNLKMIFIFSSLRRDGWETNKIVSRARDRRSCNPDV